MGGLLIPADVAREIKTEQDDETKRLARARVAQLARRARRCMDRAGRLPLRANGRARLEAEARWALTEALNIGARHGMAAAEVTALGGLELLDQQPLDPEREKALIAQHEQDSQRRAR